ncbi:hypothetical protein BDW68DRAFT_137512 [Aspergillus falconensis]
MIKEIQVDWNNLKSVHYYFAITKATTNNPIDSQKELEVFLEWWVDKKWKLSGALGNVQPLWELVRILKLYEPKSLLSTLDKINDFWEDDTARSRDHNHTYSSLPPTLTTYVIEKIESSDGWTAQVDQLLQNMSGDKLLRYKIEVMRNTFLWLDDILGRMSSWVGLLFGNDESSLIPKGQSPRQISTEKTILDQITWLSLGRTMRFWDGRRSLDNEDLVQLNGLWKILNDNSQMPIKFSFRLAVVGAKGSWQDESAWFKFNTVILRPLQEAGRTLSYLHERDSEEGPIAFADGKWPAPR